MRNIRSVRRRIRSRQYDHLYPKEHNRLFTVIYRTVIVVMCVTVLGLGLLINNKLGLVELPKQLSSIHLGMISEWLPFEDWFKLKDDKTVAAAPAYHLLKDDLYANGSNKATSILDGVVMHVQHTTTDKYSVTIRHDNGVIATYSNLDSSDLKQDERVLKDAVIGSYQNSLSIVFMKDEKKIDLSSALKTS